MGLRLAVCLSLIKKDPDFPDIQTLLAVHTDRLAVYELRFHAVSRDGDPEIRKRGDFIADLDGLIGIGIDILGPTIIFFSHPRKRYGSWQIRKNSIMKLSGSVSRERMGLIFRREY
jgi:hypothetical protein